MLKLNAAFAVFRMRHKAAEQYQQFSTRLLPNTNGNISAKQDPASV